MIHRQEAEEKKCGGRHHRNSRLLRRHQGEDTLVDLHHELCLHLDQHQEYYVGLNVEMKKRAIQLRHSHRLQRLSMSFAVLPFGV